MELIPLPLGSKSPKFIANFFNFHCCTDRSDRIRDWQILTESITRRPCLRHGDGGPAAAVGRGGVRESGVRREKLRLGELPAERFELPTNGLQSGRSRARVVPL